MTTVTPSERRTAVRMFQAPCSDNDMPSGGASPRGCAVPSAQPSILRTQASCRRSACVLLPATEFIVDACNGDAPRATTPRSSTTATASPARPRRTPPPDNLSSDGALLFSPAGSGESSSAADPDCAPPHLSVPLTLLSLHNGGLRHSPRASRDTSPLSCLRVSRDGYVISGPGATGDASDDDAASCLLKRAASTLDASKRFNDVSSSTGGTSPPIHTIKSFLLRSAPLPLGITHPTFTPPSRVSTSGIITAATTCAARDTPSAVTLVAPDVPDPGGDCGGGGHGGVMLPAHLSFTRPPTPTCKEDDLLASMRHMVSPTRRRSRFASTAESHLLAATATAIAGEEAEIAAAAAAAANPMAATGMTLQESPPRVIGGHTVSSSSNSGGSSGSVGGGRMGGSGVGLVSNKVFNPLGTPELLGCVSRRGAFGTANDSGGGGGDGVDVQGLTGSLPRVVPGGGGGDAGPRLCGSSMVWRSTSLLVPVPEDRPQSRALVDIAPMPLLQSPSSSASTLMSLSGGGGSADAAAAGCGGGTSPIATSIASSISSAPSFKSAASFSRASTPCPGMVGLGPGGAVVVGRRLRNSSGSGRAVEMSTHTDLEAAGMSPSRSFRLVTAMSPSPSTATTTLPFPCGFTTESTPTPRVPLADDALSSFMHSFETPPGTASFSLERRRPLASPSPNPSNTTMGGVTTESCGGSGGSGSALTSPVRLGLDVVVGPGLPGVGRITAR